MHDGFLNSLVLGLRDVRETIIDLQLAFISLRGTICPESRFCNFLSLKTAVK